MTPEQVATAKRVATVIGVSFLLLILVIEIVLGIEPKPSNTFSHIFRGWAIVGLAGAFGWGTVVGHFFHPVDDLRSIFHPYLNPTLNLIVAVAPILAFAIADVIVAATADNWVYPSWVPPISLAVGCVWGALAWPVQWSGG
jgi:hypothetical protein